MDKDYYKILEVTHSANDQEIKKAYRKLVMKFHPDRNQGNPRADNYFREVQEAYETLSHPGKRAAYNQQRWYRFSNRKQHHEPLVSAYSILHIVKALNRYISTIESFHINHPALNNYIHHLLSENNLEILTSEHDGSANVLIIKELLLSANHLPYKFIPNICACLIRLAGDDKVIIKSINQYSKDRKISSYWSQYLPLTILIISILLCLFIYLASNV